MAADPDSNVSSIPSGGAARSILQLLGVALGVMLAITVIGVMGYRFYLDELYPPPPPPDPTGAVEAPVEARAERLVIVVVDALREDVANAPEFSPELQRIAQTGRRGTSITQPVTMTLLSVLNLGTGRTPGLSWSVQNFEAETFPDESIFYWAHARGLPVSFNGDAAWSQLFGPYATHAVTFHDEGFYAAFEGELTKKDRASIAAATTVLSQRDAFPVVVLHLTSTDKVSHKQGALMHDPETGEATVYATTVRATDAVIGELYDTFQQPGDLWFITSDHGATDTGNHGGGEDVTRRAPWVLTGAGVVADAAPLEVSLNSWAATLSLALGLPVPRTAEVAAAYALLDLSPEERAAAHAAHLERRREFVAGVAHNLGASDDELALASAPSMSEHALPGLASLEPVDPIAATNGVIAKLREHRRWMYTAALALGVLLQLVVVFLVLRRRVRRSDGAGERRLRRTTLAATAVLWLALMTVPLVFDHWLYQVVEHLGGVLDGSWGFGRAALTVLTVTMLAVLATRFVARLQGPRADALRTGAIWLAFAFSVVATSQIVVKWPFGPLRETFLVMFTWLVGWGGYVAWRRGVLSGRHWAIGAGGVVGLVAVATLLPDSNLQLVDEDLGSLVLGFVALGAAALVLTTTIVRGAHRTVAKPLAVGIAALIVVSAVGYRLLEEPWTAKLALCGLALALAGLMMPVFSGRARRDGIFLLALGLSHVMASDWVVLATASLIGVVYALSSLRLPRGTVWAPALLAAIIGLVDIGFFYIIGYRFSFTEVDTRVVFMLDRTRIDLTASFVLITLQHSAPWLMLWAAVVGNRLAADDTSGLRTTFVAVLAVFVIRTWGTFFAMEFYLLNHWYVSHAVPMFVMEIAAAGVATLWFGVISVVLRDGWTGFRLRPSASAPTARGRAAELSAESAAVR